MIPEFRLFSRLISIAGYRIQLFTYARSLDVWKSDINKKTKCEGKFLYATLFFDKNLFMRILRLIETVESLIKFTLRIYLTLWTVT